MVSAVGSAGKTAGSSTVSNIDFGARPWGLGGHTRHLNILVAVLKPDNYHGG